MYSKVDEELEELIRKQGGIEFVSANTAKSSQLFASYEKHEIRYVYHSSNKPDKIGEFYLGLEANKKYRMGSLNITKEYEPGLRVFFLNMIIEKAIKEAQRVLAHELVVITKERFITETFLNYGFKVDRVGDPINGQRAVYSGIKHFELQTD